MKSAFGSAINYREAGRLFLWTSDARAQIAGGNLDMIAARGRWARAFFLRHRFASSRPSQNESRAQLIRKVAFRTHTQSHAVTHAVTNAAFSNTQAQPLRLWLLLAGFLFSMRSLCNSEE